MSIKERVWVNFFINPPFQFKIIGCFISLFLFSSACYYSSSYLFFWNLKNKGLKVGIPEGHLFYQFLADEKHGIDIFFLIMFVLNFILLLSALIIVTHRIAGPINKVKLFLENPENPENFHLRKSDFFQEFKSIINNIKDRNK